MTRTPGSGSPQPGLQRYLLQQLGTTASLSTAGALSLWGLSLRSESSRILVPQGLSLSSS